MSGPHGLPATKAYRIGDDRGRFRVWSGEGAKRNPGRWNTHGAEVIYAAEHLSTAMLEVLAHWTGDTPPQKQSFIEIAIPSGVSREEVTGGSVPGWEAPDMEASRRFGHAWYEEARSAILFVPSVVVPVERNLVVNVNHPDFERLVPGGETPVPWDTRLFRRLERRTAIDPEVDDALSASGGW